LFIRRHGKQQNLFLTKRNKLGMPVHGLGDIRAADNNQGGSSNPFMMGPGVMNKGAKDQPFFLYLYIGISAIIY